MTKKKDERASRAANICVTFLPDNPRVLRGGVKDIAAVWTCSVTHRVTGKKLTPCRVAVVDFPPAARDMLVYSTPADNEICDTGMAGWLFRFRGDQMHAGDAPVPQTVRLKVWVDGTGWNYSDAAWSFEECVVEGAGGVERAARK